MKKLFILLILLLVVTCIKSQIQTKAQESFENFKNTNSEYLLLENAAQAEIKVNKYIQDSIAHMNIIIHLKELGYRCDASFEDFKKLFNNSEYFGTILNQERLATDYYKLCNSDIDYFLKIYKELEINK